MKRIFAFVLCAAMLLGLTVCAAAEEAGNFLFDCSAVEGDSLFCFGAALPEGGKLKVTAGGADAAFERTTPEQANLPITYFCIVDQSSALGIVQKDHQKEALLLISEKMRANDKMVLVLMNETLTFSEPMSDREERYQAIQDACVYKARFTTLYTNVISALEQIADPVTYPGMRCVILFSDGINDKNDGVTEDSAREAIRHYRIPFNTFSILNLFPDGYALKNVARMDSFSEECPGGAHVAPIRDKTEAADGVNQIMSTMLGSTVLRLDAANLDRSRDQLGIQVLWQSGEESLTGSVSVSVDSLPPVPTEPETTEPTQPETTVPETTEPETTQAPETTETTEAPETTEATTEAPEITETMVPTTEDENARYQKESKRSRDTLIVGAVVLLVIIAIVLLLLRRKRGDQEETEVPLDMEPAIPEEKPVVVPVVLPEEPKEETTPADAVDVPEAPEEKEEPAQDQPEAVPEAPADAVPALTDGTTVLPKPSVLAAVPAPKQEKPVDLGLGDFFDGLNLEAGPGADVRLMSLDDEDATVEFFAPVNTALSLGRTAKADVVLNPDDRALSGIHFEVQWDGRVLFLRDAKSTNGTGVNGVPMRAGNWVRVNNGAIIRAGAHKYKVYAFKAKG